MTNKPSSSPKKAGSPRTAGPSGTCRAMATRLAQLREKMSELRQEEEKICHSLGQELSQCLIDAGALDVEFDVIVGGMVEVIAEAKAEAAAVCPEGENDARGQAHLERTQRTCPERSRRIEGWRKAGLTFQQGRRQPPSGGKEAQTFGTIAQDGG